jgi:hypothetical protein
MKYLLPGAMMLSFLVSVPNLDAADKQYQSGRIVNVEKKSHEKILYYLVNTPVTQEDPYYELFLQLNNFVYGCEYTPRHTADKLPEDWLPDTAVQIRVADKRHLFVEGPDGIELKLIVLKRTPGTPETTAPKPAPVQN